jgi:hypothetical protein
MDSLQLVLYNSRFQRFALIPTDSLPLKQYKRQARWSFACARSAAARDRADTVEGGEQGTCGGPWSCTGG